MTNTPQVATAEKHEAATQGPLTVETAVRQIEAGYAYTEIEEDAWPMTHHFTGFDMAAFHGSMVPLYSEIVVNSPDLPVVDTGEIDIMVEYVCAEEQARALYMHMIGLPELRGVEVRDLPELLVGELSKGYREMMLYVLTEGREGDMRNINNLSFLAMFRYAYACGANDYRIMEEDRSGETVRLLRLLEEEQVDFRRYFIAHMPPGYEYTRERLRYVYHLLMRDMGVEEMDLDYAIHRNNYLRLLLATGYRMGLERYDIELPV